MTKIYVRCIVNIFSNDLSLAMCNFFGDDNSIYDFAQSIDNVIHHVTKRINKKNISVVFE